jgi:hypothetical protein
MKTFFGVIGALIAVFAIMIIIGFGTGFIQNFYDGTVGLQHENVQRKVYEQSQSYVEGVINDLSKQKLEYDQSTDATAKQAILNYINDRYGSFDANKITDPTLQNFLLKSRGE